MTIDFEWAIRTVLSIQIGTPASARGPRPLLRSHGVVLSAMIRTSDTPSFGLHQRLDSLGTRGEAIRTDKDLNLGTVNRIDREGRAVLLGRKTHGNRHPGSQRRDGCCK